VGLIVADVRQMARAEGKTPRGLCGVFSSLFSPSSRNVFASLAGVLVFKFMLKTSNLLPVAGEDLVRSGVPLWTAAAALPFLAGLVAGVAVGFTGLSFPLVAGLMAAAGPESMPKHATLVLAYGFGYMGMMLSPVHLCLLVSRDYFASTIVATLRRIAFCVVAILVACLAGYGLLRAVGW
jgi:hypothetical protein